jgi:enoyl-CoA hydratase
MSQPALPEFKSFNVSVEAHIGHIQFSRPEKLNSMNQDFWLELPLAARALEASEDVRVIVISSTGKHFSAGMDLSVFQNPNTIPMTGDPGRLGENLRRVVLQLQDTLSALEQVRIPVLVAVHGGCIGGALDLSCCADSRYCTEDAYFTIKETEIGMTADMGTLQRLPKLMPEGVVRELAYTGRKFSAQEAHRLGFVNEVFADQEAMLEGVMEIARKIASNSPLAVTGCKEMINYARDHSVEDSLKYMAAWQSGMFRPQDMMKAFAAKAQKTEADYEALFPIKPLFDQK